MIVVLVFFGCEENDMEKVNKTLQEAKEINTESYLGLEYLMLSELSEERAKNYNSDQPETAKTDDGYVRGYFFQYPDKDGQRLLTQIRIRNGAYHVFGIMLGDDMDSASDILIQRGYKETKTTTTEKGVNTKAFMKHDVIIQLETEAGSHTISGIAVLTNISSFRS
jgi:hypothetical protein